MEGVEPSWPLDRRLLRPVRIPVSPHPHEEPQARAAERAARRFTRPAAGAAARAVPPRGVPYDAPRAAQPWLGAAPAWGVPRPARGEDASRAPLCLEGRPLRPPSRRTPRAKSEMSCGVAARSRRRRASPGSGLVGDREPVRDRADHDQPRLAARGSEVVAERLERVDVGPAQVSGSA
jgi:hypothetical protein